MKKQSEDDMFWMNWLAFYLLSVDCKPGTVLTLGSQREMMLSAFAQLLCMEHHLKSFIWMNLLILITFQYKEQLLLLLFPDIQGYTIILSEARK